jgi:hypothetical protein
MDLYVLGLKLYLLNRACGGIPLTLAAHLATTYAISATWWTTKNTAKLIGYGAVGTYKLITHVGKPSSQASCGKDSIEQDWDKIEPTEYEPEMDWEVIPPTKKIVFPNKECKNSNNNIIQPTLTNLTYHTN